MAPAYTSSGGRQRLERLTAKEWRRHGFLPSDENNHLTETKHHNMPVHGETYRDGEAETHRYRGPHNMQTNQRLTGTWVQAEGIKREANGSRKRWQTQAYGLGRRDEWRRLKGGGRGQHPGGQQSALGEEMGSRCKDRCYNYEWLIMGGEQEQEGRYKYQEIIDTGGAVGAR